MATRRITETSADKPGVRIWHAGSISWVQFLDGDVNRYSTTGAQLTGAVLAYAQAVEANVPGILPPLPWSIPTNWLIAANSP
jgi:hypothetical protein